ncbi:MAG: hypothetical protein E7477_08125 [Ruminococcaceae bacterium]|nr:hypothetical protein [Oscillospiraceae bacterium]
MKMINNDYLIKEKYCPSRKMNVPVMIFSDVSRPPQCWDSSVCTEKCLFSNQSNIESKTEKKTDM